MQQSAPANSDIEEYTIPCAEALLAGTMALMTGHVQAGCSTQREVMAGKIVSNLATLAADPLLSPGFKNLLWSLYQRWQVQKQSASLGHLSAAERSVWHNSPETVQ